MKDMVEALAMLAEGMRISRVARVKGVKADTVLVWLRRAAAHALSLEQVLLEDYHLSACQIDAWWTYIGSKEKKPDRESGSYWVCTLLESETRLRVGRGVSVSAGDAAARLWRDRLVGQALALGQADTPTTGLRWLGWTPGGAVECVCACQPFGTTPRNPWLALCPGQKNAR